MRRITAVFVMLLAVAMFLPANVQANSLKGLVVVLDPGHGGIDRGATGKFQNPNGEVLAVHEAPYVYDLALRVKLLAERRGAMVFLTIAKSDARENEPRDWIAQKVLPHSGSDKFALDGTTVNGSELMKRVKFANEIKRKFPRAKQAFISLHFDKVGEREDLDKLRIIAPPGKRLSCKLCAALYPLFDSAQRLRGEFPLVASGDDDHGIRNLGVLRKSNKIEDRALLELGNFNNLQDVWRLRSFEVRDIWSRLIVRALEEFSK